jgi:hypothetical protein
MMLGQADGPLLGRQLDRLHADSAACVEAFLLLGSAEDEGARVGGVGEEVVDGTVARARPADPPLAYRPAREPLARCDQLRDDLAGRAEPAPEGKDARDRRPDLLVGAEDDPALLVSVEANRQAERELAPLGLMAQTAVQASADQVQLGLGHRALEPEQQPVVEVAGE